MASGMATVATDVGGVAEATGDAGLIVPPQSPKHTAEACLSLLTNDGFRRWIAKAARARVLDKFTLAQNLAEYGEVYRTVVERSADGRIPTDLVELPAGSDDEMLSAAS
jgi:glycosyltransferase involved in cell wall biosynthesis